MSAPPEDDGRQLVYSGACFRAYLRAVTTLGYLDAVTARLPPTTAALLQAPPPRWEWSERATRGVIDLIDAVAALTREDEAQRLGRTVMSESIGDFLRPVFRTMVSALGTSPVRMYRELPLLSRSFVRGVRFEVSPLDERRCRIAVHNAAPLPRSSHLTWTGAFSFLDEIVKLNVSVELTGLAQEGRTSLHLVEWRPR